MYRLRRAIAATVAVLVIFGLLNLTGVVGGDGDEEAAAPTTTSETTTTTIPPPPACAEADVVVPRRPGGGVGHRPHRHRPGAPAVVRAPATCTTSPTPGSRSPTGWPSASWCSRTSAPSARRPPPTARRLSVIAGYRSYERQADLYERRVDELGDSEAGSRVARPGHSEHQLGTTIDVTTEGETDVDQSWGATPNGQWVATHAHEYGFLLSYPLDASERTCYDYEPWHLRYVGRELAAEVIDSGLSLREYLWQLEPRRHHRDHDEHDNLDDDGAVAASGDLRRGRGGRGSAGAPTVRGAAPPTPSDERQRRPQAVTASSEELAAGERRGSLERVEVAGAGADVDAALPHGRRGLDAAAEVDATTARGAPRVGSDTSKAWKSPSRQSPIRSTSSTTTGLPHAGPASVRSQSTAPVSRSRPMSRPPALVTYDDVADHRRRAVDALALGGGLLEASRRSGCRASTGSSFWSWPTSCGPRVGPAGRSGRRRRASPRRRRRATRRCRRPCRSGTPAVGVRAVLEPGEVVAEHEPGGGAEVGDVADHGDGALDRRVLVAAVVGDHLVVPRLVGEDDLRRHLHQPGGVVGAVELHHPEPAALAADDHVVADDDRRRVPVVVPLDRLHRLAVELPQHLGDARAGRGRRPAGGCRATPSTRAGSPRDRSSGVPLIRSPVSTSGRIRWPVSTSMKWRWPS